MPERGERECNRKGEGGEEERKRERKKERSEGITRVGVANAMLLLLVPNRKGRVTLEECQFTKSHFAFAWEGSEEGEECDELKKGSVEKNNVERREKQSTKIIGLMLLIHVPTLNLKDLVHAPHLSHLKNEWTPLWGPRVQNLS